MATALSISSQWNLPMLQSRTEWKLLSHHYIPAPLFPAGMPSSSTSNLVGVLDLYVTRRQQTIFFRGLDIDMQEYYEGSPHSPHRIPLPLLGPVLHCGIPDIQQSYLLNRLTGLGVDPVSSRDILMCFFKLAYDADHAGVRELYVAVEAEIININVVTIPLTDGDDDILLEEWDSEDEELLHLGPRPASKKSIMKLNEASFAAEGANRVGPCVVCLEDLSRVEVNSIDRKLTTLPCTHIFHNSCIIPWLERNGTCPLCRRELIDD